MKGVPAIAYEARGCEACDMTGYRGRNGIFELLTINEGVRQLVLKRSSSDIIKNLAVSQSMRTLREDGWRKVREGTTTVAEVLRVTQDE
jgi:type II secretory ATPase GspE/PulE/Tfp pilus assembly ATPase PilB-like protein